MRMDAKCKRWLAVSAIVLGTNQLVQGADATLSQRFPAGSISSSETAKRALDDVSAERKRIEAEYAEAQRRCQTAFFVNSCISKAKEHRRASLAPLTPIEVEANHLLRQRKVDERDSVLTRKSQESEARRQERAHQPRSEESSETADESERSDRAAERLQTPVETVGKSERELKHEEGVRRRAAAGEASAAKRAQKVDAFERKQQEAEERRQKTARRKEEKENQRKNNAAILENPVK